jgi:hypothetical protein
MPIIAAVVMLIIIEKMIQISSIGNVAEFKV